MKYDQNEILLIDNNSNNLSDLTLNLIQKGYKTQKLRYGQKAIKVAEQNQPNLILLNLTASLVDGYQACCSLKESELTSKIPIIFFSDSNNKQDKVKAIEMGGVDYIAKPFYLEEAVARVERQLENQHLQKQLQEQNILLQKEIKLRTKVETALRCANQELLYLATTDGLTGVANRRKFDQNITQEWRRLAREKAPISLIIADIDYFKLYNDINGHQAGDICLQRIAQSISHVVQRPSDLVARYGGEEFVIVLPHTKLTGAIHVANNIRVAIRNLNISHPSSSVSDYVTLSQGISSTIPLPKTNPEVFIGAADLALYDAKGRGRDCIISQSL
ncbi:MAG: GGDEF domain-containing response regulator [Waterburya sp.]